VDFARRRIRVVLSGNPLSDLTRRPVPVIVPFGCCRERCKICDPAGVGSAHHDVSYSERETESKSGRGYERDARDRGATLGPFPIALVQHRHGRCGTPPNSMERSQLQK